MHGHLVSSCHGLLLFLVLYTFNPLIFKSTYTQKYYGLIQGVPKVTKSADSSQNFHKILIVYQGHHHLGLEEDEVYMVLDQCHAKYGGVMF